MSEPSAEEIVAELEARADGNSNPHTAEGIRFAAALVRRSFGMENGTLNAYPLRAAVLRDDLLAMSLRRLYLDPLAAENGAGKRIKDTLRAYYACGCNASEAAEVLRVNRRTVATRLQVAETCLDCSLHERSAEIQAALMLDRME